jgi:hypothetical protein
MEIMVCFLEDTDTHIRPIENLLCRHRNEKWLALLAEKDIRGICVGPWRFDRVVIVDERNRDWGTLFQGLISLAIPLILLWVTSAH